MLTIQPLMTNVNMSSRGNERTRLSQYVCSENSAELELKTPVYKKTCFNEKFFKTFVDNNFFFCILDKIAGVKRLAK